MRISVLLPLERLALVKVASSLWNQHVIKDLIINFHTFSNSLPRSVYDREWEKIENEVKRTSSNLRLPKDMLIKLAVMVNITGFQLKRWVERLKRYLCTANFQESCLIFSWTDKGLIDQSKTAELLIINNSDDIIKRYELACFYCLESYIIELWYKMPNSIQEEYLKSEDDAETFVYYWTCLITKFLEPILSQNDVYFDMFKYCRNRANLSAIKFLMSKMFFSNSRMYITCLCSPMDHQRCFDNKDYLDEYVEVFCYLFNKLRDEDQNDVLKVNAISILNCFLSWPYNCIFMEVAKRIYSFLSENVFHYLLSFILKFNKIGGRNNEFSYSLLQEFWLESNTNQKQYVLQECAKGDVELLSNLLRTKKTKIISLILRIGTTEQRELIFNHLKCTWHAFVDMNDWDMVKFLVKECIDSKEKLRSLKNEHFNLIYEGSMMNRLNWKHFSSILNSLIKKLDNEGLELSHCPPSKKICM